MSTVPETTHSDAIASVPNKRSTASPTSLRVDDQFFVAIAIFILGTVFLGFARTFYLAGIYHTHVPNLLIAVHGTVFTAWIVLLVVQTGLVAGRRIALHRTLGLFGAVLAASMVVLGLAAATDSLARGFAPPGFPFGPRVFYATPVFAMITFATLIGAGLWMRSNGPAHKRLVLLATITLLPAAIGRWPFAIMHSGAFPYESDPGPNGAADRCLRRLVSSPNSSCNHARWHFPNTNGKSCSSDLEPPPRGRDSLVWHCAFGKDGTSLKVPAHGSVQTVFVVYLKRRGGQYCAWLSAQAPSEPGAFIVSNSFTVLFQYTLTE